MGPEESVLDRTAVRRNGFRPDQRRSVLIGAQLVGDKAYELT